MSSGYYQPTQIMIERYSQKRYMLVIASFHVKYKPRGRVWILCTWPLKRGQLFGLGIEGSGQGQARMQWETECSYHKFVRKIPFLLKLAEVIGRARKYP